MPAEILQNKELLEILLFRLRADFTLLETYQYEEKPPLECPILSLGGKDDHTINHNKLIAWKEQTSAKYTINLFPGEHFFINTAKTEALATIHLIIKNVLASK
jgi:medium-chain acyl-[acyl-carrier-protein] hydrolase